MPDLSRRNALHVLGGAALGLLALRRLPLIAGGSARLAVRFGRPTAVITPGTHLLGLGSGRDGLLHVPASYRSSTPSPLVLALHGATGNSQGPLRALRNPAEAHGFLVLSVDSRDMTWDAIRGEYGPDVVFIDRALKYVFDHCIVDQQRIFVEGFSDGATYALGLGLANGDLFKRIVAFSPGFIPDTDSIPRGKPKVFISHGFADPVLPKARTSDLLVPQLRKDGYDVTFAEFQGGHTILPDVLTMAMEWSGLAGGVRG